MIKDLRLKIFFKIIDYIINIFEGGAAKEAISQK